MGKAATSSEHWPGYPSWDCRVCDMPWPCDHARESLRAELRGDRVSLTMLMSGFLVAFTRDNPEYSGSVARFLGWTRATNSRQLDTEERNPP